jgi:hypothetical protein
MKSLYLKLKIPILAIILSLVVLVINTETTAQTLSTTTVMIQRTPVQGGTVTPEPGVHSQYFNSEMILTATPKSGYNFVYWIGDVGDPTSARTSAQMNSPKIIIAVFERNSFEYLAPSDMSSSSPNGGLTGSPQFSPSSGSSGKIKEEDPEYPDYPEPDPEIPVPEIPDEPIPEPATAAIVALGSWFALREKRKKLKMT